MKSIEIEGVGQKVLLNLTPHMVRLFGADPMQGPVFSLLSNGVLRLERDDEAEAAVAARITGETPEDTVLVTLARYAPFTRIREDTPHDLQNKALIVSMPVADFIVQHQLYTSCNILIPDSGPQFVVRSPEGQILGVRRFILYR